MTPEKIIGNNIKRKREEKGIKIETLGKQLNISKGRMSQIENGNCKELTINRIIKIAELLEVDFFEITGIQKRFVTLQNTQNNNETQGVTNAVTPELITALVDEFAKRMRK